MHNPPLEASRVLESGGRKGDKLLFGVSINPKKWPDCPVFRLLIKLEITSYEEHSRYT